MRAEAEEAAEAVTTRPSRLELIFSLLACALVLIGPLIYIQYEYETFTAEYGEPMEGAAGAGLALAVIFRTVSRTVLRTVIRTSARAGMRASLRGIIRSVLRVALRGTTAGVIKRITDYMERSGAKRPVRPLPERNMRSLLFASALLYASWVIVIGIGQPHGALLTRSEAIAAEETRAEDEAAMLETLYTEARAAWEADQEVKALEEEYDQLKTAYKQERDIAKQATLEEELNLLLLRQNAASRRLKDAKEASGGRVLAPDEAGIEQELPTFPVMEKLQESLFTYAPYPGHHSWRSPVIWLGGLAMVLPMWFIFFVQQALARRQGTTLRHETGIDGGFIQLYFAGAFSFMPLTSDVIVDDASPEQRGQLALAGLIAPTAIAVALWIGWRLTGSAMLVFVADAFLIYPMVQIFPLSPLEGMYLWRHSRLQWTVLFVIIMFLFLSMGSEALRSVI
ncbi:MAG: hypothetical protein ACI8S6_000957 [Myxococcota bacterium]|jgi:hypothetical protein